MMRFLPTLLLGMALTHISHRWFDTARPAQLLDPHETLPSMDALHLLSLGYPEIVADYYWLRALNHFGDITMHRPGYPNVVPMIRRVLALDPNFAQAYIFAGTALTLNMFDPQHSIDLLTQGMKHRPDVWQIPFLLGFNYYYFGHSYQQAAKYLAIAAKFPQAPPQTAPLATRLAAEAGQPELGLSLIDSVLANLTDPRLRNEYQERRKLLILELHLKWLNQAKDIYETRLGRKLTSLDELIAQGIMREIPPEPLGGTYTVDPQGSIGTTSEAKRLRLAPNALGAPQKPSQ